MFLATKPMSGLFFQVRVEFRDSRMLLPRKGNCVHQYLTVSQSTTGRGPSVEENKFCGLNSDQHCENKVITIVTSV